MLNVVYLVLVMQSDGFREVSMHSVAVPQANMRQCEVNKNAYSNDKLVIRSYCIVGVMPK